ncbi:hypothetical protein K432DRAFT_407798 [Lepidopterella palustris CBS 459.81]|uniref:Uncharacterized protein n=1 Tax=Lepidopterella palustris CBS 459.81 TaxID=1314670 RepID=A0A8E2JBX5_9PEZI|nr:hypothetical protein K432DRAFT_407798 [Lepidopterella palustris CBS 459.81]
MDSPQPSDPPISSPESSQPSSARQSIPPSNYLTVPGFRTPRRKPSLTAPESVKSDDLDHLLEFTELSVQESLLVNRPRIIEPYRSPSSSPRTRTFQPRVQFADYPEPILMSVYSTSSVDSEYSNPPARTYQLPTFAAMSQSKKITVTEKEQLIHALRSHRINTLVELRRIEKAFATLGSPDVTEPMTSAWSYYVNSHSLLTELRGLTRNYPFSSECLEEAKRRVYADPQSNRSWNFCWLVLIKIQNDQLIPYYAHMQASQPAMWGNRIPSAEGVARLTNAFVGEWNMALGQMLRNWEQPPSR